MNSELKRKIVVVGALVLIALSFIVGDYLTRAQDLGGACRRQRDCWIGLTCTHGLVSICTRACDADADCGPGFRCAEALEGERPTRLCAPANHPLLR